MIGRKRYLGVILGAITFCTSCNSNHENNNSTNGTKNVFKYCESKRIGTIHPPLISDESSKRIASQIFEGLVKLDPIDLEIQPCIAEKYSFNPQDFTYTFQLRKGVRFHNDPCFTNGIGRELTAEDVLYTYKQLCTKQLINSSFYNVLKGVVKGADEYFRGEKDNIEGIKIIDSYTIQIQLIKPNSSFLKKIAGINFSIIAKEAVEEYGIKNKIGTGAFINAPFDTYNDQYILIRNPNYYREDKNGAQLPYLDSIIVVFEYGLKKEMEKVINGEHSVALNIPVKAVQRVLRDHNDLFDSVLVMQNSPFLSTYYIEFNLTSEKLKNRNLRKAINYAINREILTQIVFGSTRGKVGDVGITHPNMNDYRTGRIKGYTYNLDSAKSYFEKCDFSVPLSLEVEIGENDYKAQSIADELGIQLMQTLGIQLKINIVPNKYKLEKTRYARSEMAITTIVSDYESPEGFLNMFYGKGVPSSIDIPSYPNTTRFKNRAFDKMMDRGRKSVDSENAYRSFASAERLLMDEAPIAVLWYEEANRLASSRLQNFPLNKLMYLDLSEVYYK